MSDSEWKCCGCGAPPPFRCKCVTGVAYKIGSGSDWKDNILAALEPVAQPKPESVFSPSEHKREFLLLASYCGGDDPACTPARPCAECLAMCNVFGADGSYLRMLGSTEPTPGQFETMCLAIEDVVTGRGFDAGPWQPIETAQRDSKARLVWVPENRCTYCVTWRKDPDLPSGGGWRIFGGGWRDLIQGATHWQPLPKLPGETTSAIPEAVKAYLRNALMVGWWRGELG